MGQHPWPGPCDAGSPSAPGSATGPGHELTGLLILPQLQQQQLQRMAQLQLQQQQQQQQALQAQPPIQQPPLQQPPPPCQSSRWLNYWPGRWCVEHGQAWRPGRSVRDGGTMELGQVPTLMSVQISSENKGLFLPVGLPCI